MSVSRTISVRARIQTMQTIDYWMEDNPEQTSVTVEHGRLWVTDFDGNFAQMRKCVREEFAHRGWKLRTIKGVKTFVKEA